MSKPNPAPPFRLPTSRQWAFAKLVSSPSMTASDAYRAVYGPRLGERSAQTEWTEASRLAASPTIVWAVEQIRSGNFAPAKVERLRKKAHAVLARRAINRILAERGRRAEVLLAAREVQGPQRRLETPQRAAWRSFHRALRLVMQAKGGQPTFLLPAQRTELIFRRLGPAVLPEPLPTVAPLSAAPAEPDDEHLAELEELVREQRARTAERFPSPQPEVPEPEPAPELNANQYDESIKAVTALRVVGASPSPAPGGGWVWEVRPIPGYFGRGAFQRRRVWKPIDNNHETPARNRENHE
jgi:hypothetical protein